MLQSRTALRRAGALLTMLFAASALAGCGSPAIETPAEVPPAPKASSKASYEAILSSKKKAPTRPSAPR